MDLVSHAVLGAASSRPHAARGGLVIASVAGAFAPDLDLLIHSSDDPLLFLEMHRQFTHSLAFAPAGALGVAALVHAGLRARIGLARIWCYCLLGYLTHIGLDTCTSYGVELLWPFSALRPALGIVAVFDPLFTLPMAGLLAVAILAGRRRLASAALVWGAAYLGFAALQAERAESAAATVAANRGHSPERLIVTPSFANTLVWKTVYEHAGRYYVDAIRTGLSARLYPGESVPALDLEAALSRLGAESVQAADLERFREVSNGYLALDPSVEDRVIELRYSLVPNRIAPYWGLELDPEAPSDAHARFVTTRERTPEQGMQLLEMVLGREDGIAIDSGLARGAARADFLRVAR